MNGSEAAERARHHVQGLTGREPESVVGLQREEHGWTGYVEALELSRVPDTTDVLAIYEVTLDNEGELNGCRRLRRYTRGSTEEEDRHDAGR